MWRFFQLLRSQGVLFSIALFTALAAPPACTQAYVSDANIRLDLPRIVVASQTNPDEAAPWLLTCLLLRADNKLEQALDACNHSVALDREKPQGYRVRGEILLALGEAERASIDYSELITLQPNEPSGYQLRGFAWLGLHRNREAFEDFNYAIRLRPRDPGGYFVRASAYEAARNHVLAIRDFGTTIALSPHDAEAWNGRCWIRTLANTQLIAALEDCREAVRLAPYSAVALNSLGFVNLRLDRAPEARDAFTRALSRSPRLAASFLGRGIAELRLSQAAVGERDIRSAKAFAPDIEKRFAAFGFTRPATKAPPKNVGGPVT